MPDLRIANIIANATVRQATVREVDEIPAPPSARAFPSARCCR